MNTIYCVFDMTLQGNRSQVHSFNNCDCARVYAVINARLCFYKGTWGWFTASSLKPGSIFTPGMWNRTTTNGSFILRKHFYRSRALVHDLMADYHVERERVPVLTTITK